MRRSVPITPFLWFLLAAGSIRPACPLVIDPVTADLRLRVFIANAARVPDATLRKAQEITSLAYQNVGIQLEWRACPAAGEAEEQFPECRGPFRRVDLFVKILAVTNAGLTREANTFGLAAVDPHGFGQTVFINFDRLTKWTWDGLRTGVGPRSVTFVPAGDRCALVLGVVIAHELGHLLLGPNSHSAKGIMRPEWSQQQLQDAYEGRQGFSPGEVRRMRENVQARATS